MPGFGSGFAHALTGGITGYQSGVDEQQKKLLVLAAQKRQIERQKQQDELARIGALTKASEAGLDVGPTAAPPAAPSPIAGDGTMLGSLTDMSIRAGGANPAPVPVKDTASMRSMNGTNPTSPEAGAANSQPAEPSQDGTVIGQVGSYTLKIPSGGLQSKAVRDQAQKDQQRVTERYNQLNAMQETVDPKFRRTPSQLRVIAANDVLHNKYVEQATGLADPKNIDPNSSEGIQAALQRHSAERDYDVRHPTRDMSNGGDNTSWQVVQTDDGTFERNPKTGQTRPLLDPSGKQIMPRAQRGILKQVAENTEQLQAIDNAIASVNARPGSLGFSRMLLPDVVSQRTDKDGVDTRAAVANVGSMLVHDRSGAAVTVSENKRLAPFVPSVSDSPDAAVKKLKQLRALIATETSALSGGSVQAANQQQPQATPAQKLRASADPQYKAFLQSKGITP